MALEEVPKKKKARRLDWRRSGPNDAMLHEQAALPMVEGGAQLSRKESADRAREDVPSPEAGGSDNLLKRMHYFALPCVRG